MSVTMTILAWSLIGLFGVLFSAIFSGVETGIYRLNRIRLQIRSEAGEPRARMLAKLIRNQHSLLATLLLSNNIVNYLSSSSIVVLCSLTTLADWQIAVVVPAIVAPVLLIFGEILPKNIFQSYSDRYTYSFAPMIRVVRWLLIGCGLLPAVDGVSRLLVRLTRRNVTPETDQLYHPRQQVGLLMAEGLHQGTLSAYQSLLIDRVMNLRSVLVGQVMVPLARVRAIAVDASRQQFVELARRHSHSRVLAYKDRPSNAVGVVPVNNVLAELDQSKPIADFVQSAPRLTVDRSVVPALFAIQGAQLDMGIVVDKNGNAVGIVTSRDLVEEIIGEIGEL